MALARYQSMAQDDAGNVLASPTIEVRRETDNALAALFSDRAGATPLANPFTAASDGLIGFHVAGGAYKITVTKGSDVRIFRYVGIGTNSEYDYATTGSGTPSDALPLINATPALAGTSALYSRGDHVHPTDTTRAPLASPAFTGSPTISTIPPVDDNTTRIPTTAWVQGELSQLGTPPAPATVIPLIDATPGVVGVATKYAREDHAHPTDTTRQPIDADLTAIAALSATGIARRTSNTPTWTVGTAIVNAELATMAAFTFKGNNTSGAATPTDIDIAALTAKASPAGGDFLLLSDQAAGGAWKRVLWSALPGGSGFVPEAPNDGQMYGRQSLGWAVVVGGNINPSNATPAMNGTGAAGASALYSRGDHVHPTDTTRQAADAELTALAGLISAADTLPYFTGSGTATLAAFTAFARTLVDDADAATMRSTLGLSSAATATPAALSKTNDTNVTLTLGGTPTTALLQATSITVGWQGTLAPARGGFGVDVSAQSGVPIFTSGVAAFTGVNGTGSVVLTNSPILTGTPKAPTATVGDSSLQIASTAFVGAAIAAIPAGASPSNTAPAMNGTAAAGSSALYARGDHVHPTDTSLAPIASPTFTGDPKAPTPTAGDNDTSIATTAFVAAAVAAIPAAPTAATAAEYVSNSAPTKMLTPGAAWSAAAPVSPTVAATLTPDFSAGIDFAYTLNQVGHTLANPTAPKVGQKGVIYLTQDGTGNRTITTWGSAWKFPGGTKPTLSTANGAIDAISYAVLTTGVIACTFNAAFA